MATATVEVRSNTAQLRTGMQQAERSVDMFGRRVGTLGEQMQAVGGRGAAALFTRFLGVGALIGGLRSATQEAQRLRDELAAAGQAIDPNTAAAARLGDAFDRVGQTTRSWISIAIRGVEQVGSAWGAMYEGLVTGRNPFVIFDEAAGQELTDEQRRIKQVQDAANRKLEAQQRGEERTRRQRINTVRDQAAEVEDRRLLESLSTAEQLEEVQRRIEQARRDAEDASLGELNNAEALLRFQRLINEELALKARLESEGERKRDDARRRANTARSEMQSAQSERESILERLFNPSNQNVSDIQRVAGGGGVGVRNVEQLTEEMRNANRKLDEAVDVLVDIRRNFGEL